MDKTNIFILVFAATILAFRIYQKYIKKNRDAGKAGGMGSVSQHSESGSKDDEYEPYSKK
jgi:hypothetical protein